MMMQNEDKILMIDEESETLGSEKIEILVSNDTKGERIDSYLSGSLSMTRSVVAKLCESGMITVDGKSIAKNYKLKGGEMVEVIIPPAEPSEAMPENIPLDVVYEDEDIIVINKPSGMVVHPAAGNTSGTLVNALLYHCGNSLSGIGGVVRPGIVHRIDKDTSGLLVVAKNDDAHLFLSQQIKEHNVSRIYYAIACGSLKNDEGTVNAPIGRHPIDRKKMAIIRDPDKSSKEAITHYRVLERFNGYTLVECKLETGRTHQIRVHMASLGHALLGDEVYGNDKIKLGQAARALIDGQCLHAGELVLTHPRTKKLMHFKSPMPNNMVELVEKLRRIQ